MKSGSSTMATNVPAYSGFPPTRRNRPIWTHRVYSKPTSIGYIQRLNKSDCWIPSCGVVARSTTWRWKRARPPGNVAASRSITITRRTSYRTSKLHARNTVRSIPKFYKMCCDVWKRPIKTSSAAFARAKSLGPPLQEPQPLPQLHLSPIRQRRNVGWWDTLALSHWTHPAQGASAHRGHAKDSHDQTRSR